MFQFLLLTLLASFISIATAQETYTNPILDYGADPWMIKHEGWYYMTFTTATNITILRSKSIVEWGGAESKLAFEPPDGEAYSTDL